jgi:hypothetical protein
MRIRIEGTLEAVAPIHHGGDERTGSVSVLRSIMVWDPEAGDFVRLPFLAGNAIRGRLRRLAMRDLLALVDFDPEGLDPKLYHALFAGGVLEKADETEGYVDLAFRKDVRELLPPLSLFGCSLRNQMMPSKLIVGNAFPVCREYRSYLPEALRRDPRAERPVRTYTDEVFTIRRDELRAGREEDEGAVQMKVSREVFIPGTLFYHYFQLQFPTEVEASCLARILDLFRESPYVGGDAAAGFGEVRPTYDCGATADAYLAFVGERKGAICDMLRRLAELVA